MVEATGGGQKFEFEPIGECLMVSHGKRVCAALIVGSPEHIDHQRRATNL
jgi:hypothetical protein